MTVPDSPFADVKLRRRSFVLLSAQYAGARRLRKRAIYGQLDICLRLSRAKPTVLRTGRGL